MDLKRKRSIEDLVFSGTSMPEEIMETLSDEEKEYYYKLIEIY